MRNIWKIFTTDIRRISNNVVAVVIIMGLSILPALYAWFRESPMISAPASSEATATFS